MMKSFLLYTWTFDLVFLYLFPLEEDKEAVPQELHGAQTHRPLDCCT